EEFQRKAFLPVCIGELEEIAALGGAGIVDENIETAEFALRQFGELSRSVIVAQIERGDDSPASFGANGGGDFVERGLIARAQQHITAGVREGMRDAAADAAARAGDEGGLAV